MSRHFKIALGVLLVFLLAAVVWLPFTPGFWLRWNVAMAERHVPVLRQLLEQDPRFRDVTVDVDEAKDGSISVTGILPEGSRADFEALVASSNPPRPILWQVTEHPFQGTVNPLGPRWQYGAQR